MSNPTIPRFQFTVSAKDVVPQPYPTDLQYWQIGDRRTDAGVDYVLVAEVHTTSMILKYWPKARDVVHFEGNEGKLYPKRPPTGDERSNIRVKFNYPEQAATPTPAFPEVPSWRSKGGHGFLTWVTVVESLTQLKQLWPHAWDITVVADGMVVN